eukprot:CAMPEP_0202387230 /NCGR_PEP_ID=MMETSP1127-20130417/70842_1 /ASSEMBLY_ACC=CAM_ASM_000462 /TAXON_ID=3047 /ORGANISM="Dunaliella tertiolecta, Strain CCMP1320" /LENGTH=136 /DNA_ID=CAMNT_0048988115 /DNA_START=45 /DNA_END=453 /DNA_ORIENTATION=+
MSISSQGSSSWSPRLCSCLLSHGASADVAKLYSHQVLPASLSLALTWEAQAQAQDAAAESHVQAPPFLGSCAGSVSTGKVLAPDGSNDVTLAAAQVSMPAGNGRITPSPVPPPNPPNTPATEAAAAPCLTPVRIQL